MANRDVQTDRPLHLPRVPLTPEQLIALGAEKMSDYLDPESGVSDHQVAQFMLELFDNPTAIEALEREQRRTGVDRWH